MTPKDFIELGFTPIPHYTVMGNLIYDLGRKRSLSVGCAGTPNEMVFLCEKIDGTLKQNVIVLHNYDYDGLITKEKVEAIILGIVGKRSTFSSTTE